MLGKRIRIERVIDRNTRKAVIVPLTHGVEMGPIEGIKDIRNSVDTMAIAGANSVILHKGIVPAAHRGSGKDIGLIIHLTGSVGDGTPTLVSDVEEAVAIGADAVSVRIEIGGKDEMAMLRLLGQVGRDACRWGMPLFALMYPVESKGKKPGINELMRAARIGAELGADVVRVPYSGSPDTFKEVVSACPVSLLALGGEKKAKEKDVLEMVRGVMDAGASGVSMGRNVFQYKKPGNMIKAVSQIVHKNYKVESALKILEDQPISGSIFSTSTPIW